MTPQELGNKLRIARENRGLSQSDLASLTDFTQRAISDIERGERKLSVLELMDFAEALELPISYFFEDKPNEITNLESVLIEEFRLLPDDRARWLAINVIRTIRKSTNT